MPRCPVCKTQTDLIKYENVPIYSCGSCGGHWLTHTKLDVILARRDVVMPEPVRQKMVEIADAADSKQRLWCMGCGREMVKEQFKHWPEIQLDRCPKCNGMWLDRGELEKCQIYWELIVDHPDPKQADRHARKAALEAHWQARRQQLRDQAETAGFAGAAGGYRAVGIVRLLTSLFG